MRPSGTIAALCYRLVAYLGHHAILVLASAVNRLAAAQEALADAQT